MGLAKRLHAAGVRDAPPDLHKHRTAKPARPKATEADDRADEPKPEPTPDRQDLPGQLTMF